MCQKFKNDATKTQNFTAIIIGHGKREPKTPVQN